MFQIDDKIISDDIFEVNFLCDLQSCKGMCCVEGDSGAPLEEEETEFLEKIFHIIKKYLPEKSLKEIEKQGLWVIDSDGDIVTPTIGNLDCVYAYRDEKGIVKCAIEKAYLNEEIDFRKPISCHLYPIRVKKYDDFYALNYDKQKICQVAVILGNKKNLPMFKFLKEPLTRKFGEEFYNDLEIAYDEYYKKREL